MYIKVAQSEFNEALQIAQKGVSSQSTLPILSGVKISTVSKDTVSIQGTDLELSIETNCPAAVKDSGEAVITGKLLVDIFRYLPDQTVELKVDGGNMRITAGKSSFSLQTMASEDFPSFPEIKKAKKVRVFANELQETIKRTAKAISRDQTRPVLTGALVEIEGKTLQVVSTDSYRLSMMSCSMKESAEEKLSVVIPHRAIDEIQKLLEGEREVSLVTDENLFKVELSKAIIYTRLIEGQFPNYDQLLPKETSLKVTTDKEELVGAINQVALLAQKNMSIKLKFSKDRLEVKAGTTGVGEASAEIKSEVEGEPIDEVAFNAQYLMDGIQGAKGEKSILEFTGPVNPGLIKSADEKNYLYLIMPIRIN